MKRSLSFVALLCVAYLIPCLMCLALDHNDQSSLLPGAQNLWQGFTLPALGLGLMVLVGRSKLPALAPLLAAACMGLLLDGLSDSNRMGLQTITCTLLMAGLIWWHSAPVNQPWQWIVSLPFATALGSTPSFISLNFPAGWITQLITEVTIVSFVVIAGTIVTRLPQIYFAPAPREAFSLSNRWNRLTPD
ncbi:hypothetical protein Spb1_33910 [Planctopirus ephydatiae]|uniref:Uncharacterized protein n=1 Tax=Planctopirus ephydatiae TaxID=2528019 RepID=A0A518GS76_9PLAN|nr:hypothetical protein [Planctopirus ephydatiae]QDV31447.1 hypothetical protein Spb1_33910 [Planctopirus ephydatiae]